MSHASASAESSATDLSPAAMAALMFPRSSAPRDFAFSLAAATFGLAGGSATAWALAGTGTSATTGAAADAACAGAACAEPPAQEPPAPGSVRRLRPSPEDQRSGIRRRRGDGADSVTAAPFRERPVADACAAKDACCDLVDSWLPANELFTSAAMQSADASPTAAVTYFGEMGAPLRRRGRQLERGTWIARLHFERGFIRRDVDRKETGVQVHGRNTRVVVAADSS